MDGKLEKLLSEIDLMPDGKAKLLMLEEAARIADSQNDLKAGFDIREEIVHQGVFYGHHLNAIIAFSWRLAQCEKNPHLFDISDLLWEYKWIVEEIYKFPDVPSEKIEQLFEDMKDKYNREGASLRPYYCIKCKYLYSSGFKERAEELYFKWINSPRDGYSDCRACDIDNQVLYLLYIKDYEKAFEMAQPILSGRLKCAEIPHLTYAELLLPSLETGRLNDAQIFHEKGYKLIYKNKDFLESMSKHLLYLTVVDVNKAVNIFEKHFQWAFETHTIFFKFEFYLASWVMFTKLKKLGKEQLKIHLQKDCNIIEKYKLNTIDDIIAWFEKETTDMANKFNLRNGNDHFNGVIQERLKLVGFQL
ncbi:MAG TPA: hypothetical protein PK033_02400 [Acetivibrio sp.]|nr:hypothetical protein [Clostridium sp.]HOQ36363.1 hypothetical protein [Acetivibrio sp.]HPT91113.1 hypothetical protein [Acetivibrio sp.]HQA56712.1 hypothetical protein [Acetivibrio sp.]